ncbi:MAG: hypothetical protein IPJ41_18655 [Phycisphaerales bacterium]|nr:hypothetical protein [Phycisphaerales bacterium]
MAGETANPALRTARKGRLWRRLRWVLLAAVAGVILLVALGPTIAAPIARPIVERAVNDQIKGHAKITTLGLSWFGAQRASLTLDDPEGARVADVAVRADRGLVGLALGSRKLGMVYISGRASIVRDAEGQTNLQRAIEGRFPKAAPAPSGGPGEPVQLPGSLSASVVLDGLEVTYTDASIASQTGGELGAVRLGSLRGSLDFAVGSPASLTIKGPIATGPDAASLKDSGSLDLAVKLTDLTDSSGRLTVDAASADVSLRLLAPALEAVLRAVYADHTVSTAGETRVTVRTAELAALLPQIRDALAAQPGVSVSALPDCTVSVESMTLPLGSDLRSASVAVRVLTSEIAGQVELPVGGQPERSPFRIEPLDLRLDAPSLGGEVTLKGGTHATIGGESAGDLSVDLAVSSLLDASGAVRKGMPGAIAGGLRVKNFSTLILQPLLSAINTTLGEGQRLNLPSDVGPTIDLALNATTRKDAAGAYDVSLSLGADRAMVTGEVAVEGQRISSREGGVRASFKSLAPILDRFLASKGVRVDTGADLVVEAQDFAVDLAKLSGTPDLRGMRGTFGMTVGETAGQMQVRGQDQPVAFALDRLAFKVEAADIAGGVHLTSDASARVDGQPLASFRADMTFADLLSPVGAPAGQLPTVRGEARIEGVRMATLDRLVAPVIAPLGLTLAKEVGDRADLVILAASNPGAGERSTNVDLTLHASTIDIVAPLTLAPDRVRSRETVMLIDRGAGATVGRFLAGRGPAEFQTIGTVRLALADIDVPIDPGFKIRPDRVRAAVTATFNDFVMSLDLSEPGDKTRLPAQRIVIDRLVASASAAPGAAPTISVEGQFLHDDQPFALALTSTLGGLFLAQPKDPADPFSVLSPSTVRPEASLKLTGVPASLARIVPPSMAMVGDKPLDVALVWRDILGKTFDLTATTSPSPNLATDTRFGVELRGTGINTTIHGRLDPTHVRLFKAEGWVGVTPRLASHLATLFAPDAPVLPALSTPARLGFALQDEFEVPLLAGFRPDPASIVTALAARATVDLPLAATTLPAAEGAEAMVIPPLTVSGLTIDAAVPGSALGASGGNATAKLAGKLLAADGSGLADLAGSASASLKAGKPAGAMPVSLALTNISAAWIDTLLKKPSLVAGSVGDRFSVSLDADPDRYLRRDPSAPVVSVNIQGPRFKTDTPIAVAVNKEAAFIKDAFTATWTMGPRWANTYMLGATSGSESDGTKPSLAFTEQTPVQLRVSRLAIAMAEGAGPLKPGVFLVDAVARVPDLAAKLSDGRPLRFGDLEFRVGRGPTPDQLGFALLLPRMKIADQPESKPSKSQITGRLASFTDEAGHPAFAGARLDLAGGLAPLPTDVIDGLARQNGLLTAALGPTVDFSIDAKGFSKQGGTLRATAVTPLAKADISGRVDQGLFILDPKLSSVEISQITQEFTKRVVQKAVPVLSSLEKTAADEPARVIFETPIAVPLDGNMDRLNGVLTFDIGTARFATGDIFQKVLAFAQQKTAGEVGRRLPPLKVTMANGLVSYDTFALPFGEFRLETQGYINLSSKARQIREGAANDPKNQLPSGELEVMTFIPAGAFAAEAVPALSSLPLPIIGQMARLPIRTHGLIASPKNDVATDLVGKEALNELIAPGKLLDDGAKGILDRLLGGGKDK